MFVGNLARLCRRKMSSTGKAIPTAESDGSQMISNKAEKLLTVATGIVTLGMLGFEIMSVRDFKADMTKIVGDNKADLYQYEQLW